MEMEIKTKNETHALAHPSIEIDVDTVDKKIIHPIFLRCGFAFVQCFRFYGEPKSD